MFDCIEALRHNVTFCDIEAGYFVEIVWEDLSWLDDARGGSVWVGGEFSHRAY